MAAKKPKPTLTLVGSSTAAPGSPPRALGKHGMALWRSVTSEYGIEDCGGIEMLAQACAALDTAEGMAAIIAAEGMLVHTRQGPKEHPLLKLELANRSFVVRTLSKLGLDVEPVGRIGRPGRSVGFA